MTRPVVAVDLGDTSVAAVLDVASPGRASSPSLSADAAPGPEPVDLEIDLAGVFAPGDGDALVTGAGARRRGAADPARYEPTPRRRADEGELLLGTRTVGVAEAWGAVVSDAVARAGSLLRGGRPRGLVLTHPWGWDSGRVELLRRAGSGLADELVLLTEPVAAASYASWMRPRRAGGSCPVAILDVGATAAAASVVAPDRGEVLAHRRDERFGGADADEMLLAHLLSDPSSGGRAAERFREVAAGATLGDRRHRQVLLDDVRAAKERLSDAEQAEIPLPGGGTAAWLARGEIEEVLGRSWRGVVALLAGVVASAGTTPERLDAVWLTGGAARTPQLATLVHRELGVPATVAPDPGLVAARGALVAAREIADRRATLARPAGSTQAVPSVARASGAPTRGGPSAGSSSTVLSTAGSPPPSGPDQLCPDDPAAPFGPDDPLGWDPLGDDDDDDEDVSGGLDANGRPLGPGPEGDTAPIPTSAVRGARAGPPIDPNTDRRDPSWLPAGRRSTDRRRRAAWGALVAAVVIVLGTVVIVAVRHDDAPSGSTIDAYAHRFVVPVGWVRAGGDDAARRTVLRPVDAPRGADLIAVQDNPVDGTDPAQVREQLRVQFDAARAAGSPVADLQPDGSLGGRDVVRYRQDVSPGVRVDWVVVLTPGSQVSVGCRHDTADAEPGGDTAASDRVRAACDHVVATVGPPDS